jgi:hypothetical protein
METLFVGDSAKTVTPANRLFFGCFLAILSAALMHAQQSQTWPYPIPCRIHDGTNKNLRIMTLGDPQSPLADGLFDPVSDWSS